MKRIAKWFGFSLLFLLIAAGALSAHTWYAKPLSVNWFYTRVFAKFSLENPELLTQLRMLEGVGIRGHNGKFGDSSPAYQDRAFAEWKEAQATLKSYDSSSYKGQDKLSYEIMDYFLDVIVRGEPWRYHDYPVNQLFGVQSELPNLMASVQQVNDATDAEHYIARVNAYPLKMAQIIEGVKLREAKGVIPPRFVVEKVSEQIKGFLASGAAGNVLTVSLKEKLDKIPAEKMSADARATLMQRVEKGVADNVIPAYQGLAAYIETLRAKATQNNGVWALPQGDAYYQYLIELHTTTKMTADEVHALGLAEVARIGTEMDAILTNEGYTQQSRAARIAALSASPSQRYPETDEGRAQALKDYQAIIDEIAAGLTPYFNDQPKAKVVVERIPVFKEKTSPGAYYNGPAFDGSKPGVFYANMRKVGEIPKFTMKTLAYHEAIPGHHTQIATAQEIKGLPIFRGIVPFTAYQEGWALYAERLAWEAGFEKNPLDNLGRLQAEMFRAVRLVVDSGIHAKRWTREQAIAYMMENTGMPEAEVVAEIERYFVMPGQALAYKIGMMKILALREQAKNRLGTKFDIRTFHDAVLKNGAMPLSILDRTVNGYVEQTKG